ncbi:Uma2 family endonuclease [Komarekiella sp. 'clone 1']|uniref:Uma2 family endonuclease n=1 Tax=Komarekiella delphini-convector SJRDD-AB1 TaxID=2593771 RepID=A0AA40VVJ7_9NOST|nr:Uma2 family endonuclease [Komarekiella delphini-convector]MBD6621081.1 Uma2 family endonuclease [Komarekiella delphini-convector SJRDD-AB1]
MIQSLPIPVTVDQFLNWYPLNSTQLRYELHNGFIKPMPPPTGDHELVLAFLTKQILLESDRLNLPFYIPKIGLIRSIDSESVYLPDILLLNRPNLSNEPLWKPKSTVTQSASVPLVVEIVSTNWRDDYFTKLGQYEAIGISEYWIVDYAALGGRKFIGNPKQPTISIYYLVEGEYQVTQFRDGDRIQSPMFLELNLTAEQIFQAGDLST